MMTLFREDKKNASQAVSSILNRRQLYTLERLGDLIIPGDSVFPSFSETGCIRHFDQVMGASDPLDIRDFTLLMSVLSVMPNVVLAAILQLVSHQAKFPNIIAGQLRLLNIGLQGVVLSLYYSNKTSSDYRGTRVFDVIDYNVACK